MGSGGPANTSRQINVVTAAATTWSDSALIAGRVG
jgi:hypothetical protein